MRPTRAGRSIGLSSSAAKHVILLLATLGTLFSSTAALPAQDVSVLTTLFKNIKDYTNMTNATAGILQRRQAPISVMVVGDSITQGHEGDWTWRYRLWEWFRDEGIAVDFVGPFIGTRVCVFRVSYFG
jgi:hypothetical protein